MKRDPIADTIALLREERKLSPLTQLWIVLFIVCGSGAKPSCRTISAPLSG
jgi:hypothetical protein